MPKFARFDPNAMQPTPVTGWYDTDDFFYSNLPTSNELLLLTSVQWSAHFINPSGWSVNLGQLISNS